MPKLPSNPLPTDPMSLASGVTGTTSKAASSGARLAQSTADTTLGTAQSTTGDLQKRAQTLPGPLGAGLGALPLDATIGTVRGVTNTALTSVRVSLLALRAWLASVWMLRWVRLIVQWVPTVIATMWIGAQLLGRFMPKRRQRRR